MSDPETLTEEIERLLTQHSGFCEFNKPQCDCVDIRLLRAAHAELLRQQEEIDRLRERVRSVNLADSCRLAQCNAAEAENTRLRAKLDARDAEIEQSDARYLGLRAERDRLREAIEHAKGFYQVTHIHAVLDAALTPTEDR